MTLPTDFITGGQHTAAAKNATNAQINQNTADIATKADTSAIPDELTDLDTTVTGAQLNSLKTKVDGIEASADVTDAANVGSSIHGASAKTTPVDADTVALIDSEASNVLKKLSWSNIKAAIKSYYDSVTATLSNKDLTSGTNTFPTFNQNTTGSAATLTTSRTVRTNLASTSTASFNGSANITPGVTGTLPVGNGGTGATTLTGLVKGNGTSAFTVATAGTDYVAPGGALGTPSSGTLTNCTGLPMSGLGTGKVSGSNNGTPTSLALWVGTAAQYAAIGSKDSNTVYVVTA